MPAVLVQFHFLVVSLFLLAIHFNASFALWPIQKNRLPVCREKGDSSVVPAGSVLSTAFSPALAISDNDAADDDPAQDRKPV
jgi:hypothetical protein